MHIVAFDIEYNPARGKLLEYGIISNNGISHRGTRIHELIAHLDEADVLIGHNIIYHDLKILQGQFGYQHDGKLLVDTLFVSALLFASKPYHKLTKDYFSRIKIEEASDPRQDSRIVLKKLLPELLEQWMKTDPGLQTVYYHLLKDQPAFTGFFPILGYEAEGTASMGINELSDECFCSHKDLNLFIDQHPVELAYALGVIHADNDSSILPAWLVHTFPIVADIIAKLRFEDCHQPSCEYCSKRLSAVAGLTKFFGFKAYRSFNEQSRVPLQQVMVEAGLRRESLLAVLPTGGGKSICYQVPALMAHELKRSLTVIISPLQSLMKDQVDNLIAKNIFKAFTINGLVDPISRMKAVEAVENGAAAMLYISPESLRSGTIFRLVLRRDIERFVIDEAHCFSSWGHDFRPDYMYIAEFIRRIQESQPWNTHIPVSCFTATANPEVAHDITDYFDKRLGQSLIPYTADTKRDNLSFDVVSSNEEEKFDRLLQLLDDIDGPTIIYAARVKRCEELTAKLNQYHSPALVYHGQLDPKIKKEHQDQFIAGKVDIMVATSAFGMGVDKEDVRHVIHYEISPSLENYVQEAGRAGRNPAIDAKCHVLFDESDIQKHFNLLNATRLNKKDVEQIWRAIKLFKQTQFSKSALEIAEKAGWDIEMRDVETRVKTAIANLEEEGFLKRNENASRLFAKNILVASFEEAREIIISHFENQSGEDQQNAIRIMQYLVSRQNTQVDSIAMHLGLETHVAGYWINKFKDWKILGDEHELEAFVSTVQSKNSSRSKLKLCSDIELELVKYFKKCQGSRLKIYFKEVHDTLHLPDRDPATFYTLHRLINFWELNRKIRKEPVNSILHWVRITFVNKEEKLHSISKRNALSSKIMDILLDMTDHQDAEIIDKHTAKVTVSVLDLQKELGRRHRRKYGSNAIEEALYFLIMMEIITIKGGLLVFYNPMKIERLKDTKTQYTNQNFARLRDFYERKTERIHIVGEYARKMLRSNILAMQFVDDYFKLSYDQFIDKYFKGAKGKIKRPITEKQFRQVFGMLSQEQLEIVKDDKSSRILVAAGPGSGKTRVLVHKVAAILLMEDVKPDQFLMLTFSRSAVQEMRKRLYALIGSIHGVDIKTFHSYAFDLTGRVGDLGKSSTIIREAILQLDNSEIYLPQIGKKEVILVDEFQDIDAEQFELLKHIVDLAGNVRTIVVGDDDQNIYDFRKSSVEYMQQFARSSKCKTYYLTKNFRSRQNLVSFANAFAHAMPGPRIKDNYELVAHNQQDAVLEIHSFPRDSHPLPVLTDDVISKRNPGSTAILTRTNEEALQVHTLLHEAGHPASLLLNREGYRVSNLLEMEAFTAWVSECAEENTGLVFPEQLDQLVADLKKEYNRSEALPGVLEAIRMFRSEHSHFFKTDWFENISELRQEDILPVSASRTWVSTIHKSKGREFDNVYLYLHSWILRKPVDHRVLYVAITRAKAALKIYTNSSHLRPLLGKLGSWTEHQSVYPPSQTISIQLSLADVHLGKVKRQQFQNTVSSLLAGDKLKCYPGTGNIKIGRQKVILSRKGKELLQIWHDKGYVLDRAVADQIVLWRDAGEEYKLAYRVPLPRVVMRKT